MRNGECPKCRSQEVYAIDTIGHQSAIPIGWWHVAMLTYLICTKCGYVESYIFSKASLARISKKGQRVAPMKAKDRPGNTQDN